MALIDVIGPADASGRLDKIYRQVASADGQVDNVLQIHSLRPHSLEGHMAIYRAVLHHPRNALPKWFLEAIGVLVSRLNGCDYCASHHAAGLQRLLSDEPGLFEKYLEQLKADRPAAPFTDAQQAALDYAGKLTLSPAADFSEEVEAMRKAGLDDGQILEVNQVAAYFAYANRTVNGLGVSSDGEVLGLSPSGEDGWQHR